MARFLVEKSGPLKGEVTISGAKNSVLPILAATLLSQDTCHIDEVPDLKDVTILCSLLASLGCKVERHPEESSVDINASEIITSHASEELVKMILNLLNALDTFESLKPLMDILGQFTDSSFGDFASMADLFQGNITPDFLNNLKDLMPNTETDFSNQDIHTKDTT